MLFELRYSLKVFFIVKFSWRIIFIMRCQYCVYEGPRSDFPRNLKSIQTTASGLKPRKCIKCNQDNFFAWGEELEEDELELKQLCMEIEGLLKADKIDKKNLRKQLKEMKRLNTYLNAEWVDQFMKHTYRNMTIKS